MRAGVEFRDAESVAQPPSHPLSLRQTRRPAQFSAQLPVPSPLQKPEAAPPAEQPPPLELTLECASSRRRAPAVKPTQSQASSATASLRRERETLRAGCRPAETSPPSAGPVPRASAPPKNAFTSVCAHFARGTCLVHQRLN